MLINKDTFKPTKVDSDYSKVYLSGYDNSGKKCNLIIENFQHYFYSSDMYQPILERKLATKRCVTDQGNMKMESAKYTYTYEADLTIARRYIIDTFGQQQVLPYVKLRTAYIDIENDYEDVLVQDGEYPITCISVHDNWTDKTYTFYWNSSYSAQDPDNYIIGFKEEYEMLKMFLQFMQGMNFDVWTSYSDYDIKYICGRLRRIDEEIKSKLLPMLSPFNKVNHFNEKYTIFGVNYVDYMLLYKKWSNKSLPSNSLAYIAEEEKLPVQKLKFEGSIKNLWKTNPALYIEYNRQDVLVLYELDKKMKFIELADQFAKIGCCNLEEGIGYMRVIDNLMIRILNGKGFVSISKKRGGDEDLDTDKITGAYNYERMIPGFYPWMIDNDVTSMYPYVMMNLDISPETYVDKYFAKIPNEDGDAENEAYIPKSGIKKFELIDRADAFAKGYVVAGNGAIFNKSKTGIVPAIAYWLFHERVKIKDEMFKAIEAKDQDLRSRLYNYQYAVKRLMNSLYGVIASPHFRHYSKEIGEAVTITGQKLIKFAIQKVKEQRMRVISGDTDSILFSPYEDFADAKVARAEGMRISQLINDSLIGFSKSEFNINDNKDSRFNLKQEVVARKVVFFAKKHYAMHKVNIEGRDVDEVEYKGISIVQNTTPAQVKIWLRKIFDVIVREGYNDKSKAIVADYEKWLRVASFEQIGTPCSMSKTLGKYAKSGEGAPVFVTGARYWEEHFAKLTGIGFGSTNKGVWIYVKPMRQDLRETYPETHVITVPDGAKFPADVFDIDYDQALAKHLDSPLEDVKMVFAVEEKKQWIRDWFKAKAFVTDDYTLDRIFDECFKLQQKGKDLKLYKIWSHPESGAIFAVTAEFNNPDGLSNEVCDCDFKDLARFLTLKILYQKFPGFIYIKGKKIGIGKNDIKKINKEFNEALESLKIEDFGLLKRDFVIDFFTAVVNGDDDFETVKSEFKGIL